MLLSVEMNAYARSTTKIKRKRSLFLAKSGKCKVVLAKNQANFKNNLQFKEEESGLRGMTGEEKRFVGGWMLLLLLLLLMVLVISFAANKLKIFKS